MSADLNTSSLKKNKKASLFIPQQCIPLRDELITVSGERAKYLTKVLRINIGDIVELLDGEGGYYLSICKGLKSGKVFLEIIEKIVKETESPLSITLAQAIPKGSKMDLIVQKAVEIGVSSIIPIITEYTQIKRTEKIERWKKIVVSAVQQSGR
ncbi:MAG: 16S rRNA (uracil(1498)-N(3))-methyltransferase, partial [Nitrospirae bacterium]